MDTIDYNQILHPSQWSHTSKGLLELYGSYYFKGLITYFNSTEFAVYNEVSNDS